MEQLQISFEPYKEKGMETRHRYDLNEIIFDLDSQIKILSSQADKLDYLVSIASGLLCGGLDIFWTGSVNLEEGRAWADNEVYGFVKNSAKMLGC